MAAFTWLYNWQTLVAAGVALFAAFIALRQTDRIEARRRRRKHAAIRAVLPLALAQVTTYAESSAHALRDLITKCVDGALPPNAAPEDLITQLPSETLKTLAEFIEYSDKEVEVLESTVALIQIHESRLRGLCYKQS